jgi:hypothetical protein
MFQFMFMVQLLVKFRFFIQELWERKSLHILYECWRRAYHARSWRSCLLDLGFNFHLEFRQYKLKWKIRSLPWFFCVNKLSFLYCLNKTFSSYSNVSSHWLQLLCQSALSWNEDYLQEKSDLQKETRWLSLCSRGRATSDDIGREFCLLWLVWWALQYAHNVLVVLVCKYIYNDLLIWWGFSCYN